MSEYVYWLNACVAAEHVAVGDAMSALLGPEPGDSKAFSQGSKLRRIGDSTNATAAYGVSLAVKKSTHDCIAEFNSDGPWAVLNSIGATDQVVLAAKQCVSAECGPRAEKEGEAAALWASLGYERALGAI